jgi:hypothetical protein
VHYILALLWQLHASLLPHENAMDWPPCCCAVSMRRPWWQRQPQVQPQLETPLPVGNGPSCTLICSDGAVEAHKELLSVASPVLASAVLQARSLGPWAIQVSGC